MKTFKITSSKYFIFLFSAIVMFSFQECSKSGDDNVGDGGGGTIPPICDVSNVTFSATVWPIISANCTSYHSDTTPQNGMRLENYATIKNQAGIPAGSSGSLYGAITHNTGNFNMPKNAAKLSDCNILEIKTWIDAGMPNN